MAAAGTLLIAGCGGDDDDASTEPVAEEIAATAGVDSSDGGFVASDDAAEATAESSVDSAGTSGASPDFDIGVVGRDVIVEMRVVLASDDIQRTVAAVMAEASTLGGGVASSDVNYGEPSRFGSEGFAVLVVKVPPESIDRLLDGLDDTAEVRSINQSAQDVTEQLVDLDVRIRNARQSVDNVRGFMERTENLDELVRLEAELTRRQTDLERLEAQQRDLADRVALSTVTIEVVPASTLPTPSTEDRGIGDALSSGWDAFTTVLFGLGFVIAAGLPFIVSGLLVALVMWLIIRRRDAARHESAAPMPAPVADEAGGGTEDADDREPEPMR